jgi:uncharacterized membrane protein YhdT
MSKADTSDEERKRAALPVEPPGSPLRSTLAVCAGYTVMWITAGLYGSLLFRFLPDHFAEGAPTGTGLALLLAGALPSGLVAGLIAGRLAGWAHLVHAAALAGLIGFAGMMSSDAAQGTPAWFALGRILVPALAVVLGGLVARQADARLRARRRAASED